MRAVIVTGAGRGFCAGADLGGGGETFDWRDRDGGEAGVPRDGGGQVSLRIFDSLKPVIAAINGPAVGVGITMTLPMDMRLAADGAKIGFVFARRGIVPEACSSWFLPRIVGISQAMEWVGDRTRVHAPRRRSPAGSCAACTRRTSCSPRRARWRARSPTNAAPVSVALARRLMWTMLGARAPDGGPPGGLAGDVRPRPVGRRARGRRRRSSRSAPPQFPDRVSDGLPELFPGGRSRRSARRGGTRARRAAPAPSASRRACSLGSPWVTSTRSKSSSSSGSSVGLKRSR